MFPEEMAHLPIAAYRTAITGLLAGHQVVVVAGETGCGKSTCLPFICREAGCGEKGRIAITQPRRIAAVSLASYSAALAGGSPGGAVGYKVRYRQSLDTGTRIIYMTDGVLLASLAGDPQLSGYDCIIIDEAHERSVTIDFLLGYLRTILPHRPQLRLVIASATLDTGLFSRAFGNAPVVKVHGRRFDVEVRYRPVIELWKGRRIDSIIEGAIVAATELCASDEPGNILIFMPTVDDVMETTLRLRHRFNGKCSVLPLHGRLALDRQREVFAPVDGRKIVVATNIAETSLTVPDIRFVIDTGLARVLRYEAAASLTRMPVERVSQASAQQRAGRCGRVRDGICIRLYSEQDFRGRSRFTLPEIKRTGLAGLVLRMLALRLGDPLRFPFLLRPHPAAIAEGYRLLQELGAVDKRRHLTPSGRIMTRFPLDPPVACMLIRAREFGVTGEVMVIAAALSVQDPLCGTDGSSRAVPREFMHPDSDYIIFLKVWRALRQLRRTGHSIPYGVLGSFCERYGFQHLRIREWIDAWRHIRRICRDLPGFSPAADAALSVEPEKVEAVHKSLLAGLIHGIAVQKEPGVYNGTGVDGIRIAPASVTARKELPFLLCHEIVATDRVYAARAAAIEPKWVEELFGRQCRYRHADPQFDPQTGGVTIREEVSFKSLVLVRNRLVDCAQADRDCAVEVFVREGLVNELIGDRYRFVGHNRIVRDEIASAERKLRRPLYAGDDALEGFYREQAPVASRKELGELVAARGDDSFLMVPRERLRSDALPCDIGDYVDEIIVASYRLPVTWTHDEAGEADGATVHVPLRLAEILPGYWWEWQLPVLRASREAALVSRLTTSLIGNENDPADAVTLLGTMAVPDEPYCAAAARLLHTHCGIEPGETDYHCRRLPKHLWLRVTVTGEKGCIVDSFRPPLTHAHHHTGPQKRIVPVLQPIADGMEQPPPLCWGDRTLLQPCTLRAPRQQVPCVVYPVLYSGSRGTEVKIHTYKDQAFDMHSRALARLVREELAEPMAWESESMAIPPGLPRKWEIAGAELYDAMVNLLERMVCRLPETLPSTEPEYRAFVNEARGRIQGAAAAVVGLFVDTAGRLERCRQVLLKRRNRYTGRSSEPLHAELNGALEEYGRVLFSNRYGIGYLQRLPEFLDAFPGRAAAAFLDTVKYRSSMRVVTECRRIADTVAGRGGYRIGIERERLEMMIEQYMIEHFTGQPEQRENRITGAGLAKQREYVETVVECAGDAGHRP